MKKLTTVILVMLLVVANVMAKGTWRVNSINNGQTGFQFKETALGRVYLMDVETKQEIPVTIDQANDVVNFVVQTWDDLKGGEGTLPQDLIDAVREDLPLNAKFAKQNHKKAIKELKKAQKELVKAQKKLVKALEA